jgi:hypothetical protein
VFPMVPAGMTNDDLLVPPFQDGQHGKAVQ